MKLITKVLDKYYRDKLCKEINDVLEEMKSIIDTGKNRNGIKVDGYGFHGRDLKWLYDYITNLQQDNEMYAQLKDEYEEEIKEANDSITWWTNRFKAVERDNKELQQENERLKEIINDDMTVYLKGLEDGKEKMKQCFESIYKSRCEKATEYIDKQKKKMYKSRNKIALFVLMKLENILQNGSENNE